MQCFEKTATFEFLTPAQREMFETDNLVKELTQVIFQQSR